MLLDGLPERARDRLADQIEAHADERAEEIEWLAELLPGRVGLGREIVRRVLEAREQAIAEADGQA